MASQPFFEAVREAAPSGIWSRGVRMSREATVGVIEASDDEVELEVRVGAKAFELTFYLDDEEWDCTCDSSADACDHVVAGVITWHQAAESGEGLGERVVVEGSVAYELQRDDRGLFLVRLLRFPDGRQFRLDMPLARYLAKRSPHGAITVTSDDQAIEKALGERWGGRIGREIGRSVLKALMRVSDLRLDKEPVRASLDPVHPIAVLSDHPGGGFELRLEQDPSIDEVFRCGWVRCGMLLQPIGDGGLTRREIQDYRRGRLFRPGDIADLVGELLPQLRKGGLPVEVRTSKLPTLDRIEVPRLVVNTVQTLDARLKVFGEIVYGDPVVARVVDGQLEVVGDRVPMRDRAEERRLADELKRQIGLSMGVAALAADEEAVSLAERIRAARGIETSGDAIEQFRLAAPITPELAFHEDGRMSVTFAGAHGQADAGAVMTAWRSGRSLAPLSGGGFAPLPSDWLAKFGHQLSDLLAARDAQERLAPAALPAAAQLMEALSLPTPARLRERIDALREALGRPDDESPELPDDFTATLRPYQAAGVDWMRRLGDAGMGALLADDMGLGKTVQTLATVPGEPGRRSLVVAPTSVLANWASEAKRFRPGLQVSTYHGANRALNPDAHLTLTSYALLRLDLKKLQAVHWDLVVLDEAQAIKNAQSQVTQAAHRIRSQRRIALTGTPVENRLSELWSQFHFINPGLLGGPDDFQERYAKPVASGDAAAVTRLRQRIAPFLLRRLKRDVAPELPPRTEAVLKVTLSDEERAVYDAIAAATRKEVVEQLRGGGNVMKALEALLRLRQACCDSALIPGQKDRGTSAKVELLVDQLSEAAASGHRALVFSQWTSLLDRIEPVLRNAEIDFVRLDGSTRDRGGVVDTFQADDGPPVLLLSLKAGGTGLNLTAADHVFLMDPWWNPAVEDQASDRAYRIGQDKPVVVYRMVAEDSVEERIIALQEQKRALAKAALGEAEAAAATGLGREELLALLG